MTNHDLLTLCLPPAHAYRQWLSQWIRRGMRDLIADLDIVRCGAQCAWPVPHTHLTSLPTPRTTEQARIRAQSVITSMELMAIHPETTAQYLLHGRVVVERVRGEIRLADLTTEIDHLGDIAAAVHHLQGRYHRPHITHL